MSNTVILPGVILKTRFVTTNTKNFNNYIDYIDRDEAKKGDTVSEDMFSVYQDYMGNTEKTSSLFTSTKDKVSEGEKEDLKNVFQKAQNKNSILWQDVISFDNKWLEEHGVYDPITKTLDEKKLMSATRAAMNEMMKREGLEKTAIWSGAIHYNTDNIHVHVATVEPNPTRTRGKRKPKTLDMMKSKVINSLMNRSEEQKKINDLIRKNMVDRKKDDSIFKWRNRKLKSQFLEIYHQLPEDRRQWQYGYHTIDPVRPSLDKLSKDYIEKYHKKDYELFLKTLDKEVDVLKRAYGEGPEEKKRYENYKQNKMDELHKRMGNAFLNEMKAYDRQIKNNNDPFLSKQGKAFQNNLSLIYTMRKVEKVFGKEYGDWKNQRAYDELQRKIEEQERG
ncbi:MobP2 family relaxase [Bacillus sp. 37MA]|uniref:MobP2 family relaxase n=1 Tax=Bacillus sp. 37MA TaxID=1132442 RepID=UPI00035ED246|nr:MobP2 family relaxase [Bacillus sp. 37MA]